MYIDKYYDATEMVYYNETYYGYIPYYAVATLETGEKIAIIFGCCMPIISIPKYGGCWIANPNNAEEVDKMIVEIVVKHFVPMRK